MHANDTIKTSDTVLRKIYLSLYWKGSKGFTVRGSWRPNRTATYWSPFLWPSALCLSRSQPEARGPSFLLGAGFLYHNLSPKTLRAQTNWLPFFTEFYNSSIAHSISLHTGHRNVSLPPSLEWHVWSSLSGNDCHAVHRSLSSGTSVCGCTVGF